MNPNVKSPEQLQEDNLNTELCAENLVSELTDSQYKAARILLINTPALLQDDIAEAFDISLDAVAECKVRPENIKLSELREDDLTLLTSTGLGKVILQRRQDRINNIVDNFARKRQEEQSKKTELQESSNNNARLKRQRTMKSRKKAQINSAKRRSMSSSLASKEKTSKLRNTREQLIIKNEVKREQMRLNLDKILTSDEISFLSLLDKPDKETSQNTGHSLDHLVTRSKRLRDKLGIKSRIELVLWAHEHGVSYDIPKYDALNNLTIRQRQVATRLANLDGQIAEQLGITKVQVARDVSSLIKKTNSSGRTELALIAQANLFEPLPEEHEDDVHESLLPFTKDQREIVSRIHLPSNQIAIELSKSATYLVKQLKKARETSGTSNNMKLALSLYDQGHVFSIKKLGKPTHELLSKTQLSLARLAEYPNEHMAKELSLNTKQVETNLSYARRKLGARSRIELVLMMKSYDSGENKKILSREEQFFEAIGIDPIPMEDARKLLGLATETQAKYIEAFYFNEANPNWSELVSEFFVIREMIMTTAKRGLSQIRIKIEQEKIKRTDPNFIHPRKRELFKKLGIDTVSDEDIKTLLESIPEKRSRYIQSYYLSDNELPWADTERKYGISHGAAKITADRGVQDLKTLLELKNKY